MTVGVEGPPDVRWSYCTRCHAILVLSSHSWITLPSCDVPLTARARRYMSPRSNAPQCFCITGQTSLGSVLTVAMVASPRLKRRSLQVLIQRTWCGSATVPRFICGARCDRAYKTTYAQSGHSHSRNSLIAPSRSSPLVWTYPQQVCRPQSLQRNRTRAYAQPQEDPPHCRLGGDASPFRRAPSVQLRRVLRTSPLMSSSGNFGQVLESVS